MWPRRGALRRLAGHPTKGLGNGTQRLRGTQRRDDEAPIKANRLTRPVAATKQKTRREGTLGMVE